MNPADKISNDRTFRTLLLLALGILAVSSGALLVRLAQCPPITKAAWRTGLAALLLAPWAWRQWRAHGSPPLPWKPVTLAGVFMAAHFATWITSLETISVASSVLLVNTTPLFVVLLSPAISREPRTRKMMIGVGLGFAGAALIPLADGLRGTSPVGALLALLGAVSWAAYALLGKRLTHSLPLLPYLALTYLVAALSLVLLAILRSDSLVPDNGNTLLALIALALIPQLLGHSLLNRSIRKLPTGMVALSALMEPIFASLLVAIFLGELPPTMAYWAAPLILGGILLSHRQD